MLDKVQKDISEHASSRSPFCFFPCRGGQWHLGQPQFTCSYFSDEENMLSVKLIMVIMYYDYGAEIFRADIFTN